MRIRDWSSDVCSSDLPLPQLWAQATKLGYLSYASLPGDRSDCTLWPGATTSGLATPSASVGPRDENAATASSAVSAVPWSSLAPTVMTHGSSPGLAIVRDPAPWLPAETTTRSEEHTSELQSLMRISYAVFCLKKKKYIQCL